MLSVVYSLFIWNESLKSYLIFKVRDPPSIYVLILFCTVGNFWSLFMFTLILLNRLKIKIRLEIMIKGKKIYKLWRRWSRVDTRMKKFVSNNF